MCTFAINIVLQVLRDVRIGRKVEELFRHEFRLPLFFHTFPWLELDMSTLRYFCRLCRRLPNAPDDAFCRGLNVAQAKHVNLMMHEQSVPHCMVSRTLHYTDQSLINFLFFDYQRKTVT